MKASPRNNRILYKSNFLKLLMLTLTVFSVYSGAAYAQTEGDTLRYPFQDNSWDPFNDNKSLLELGNPSNVKQELIFNPETGRYEFTQKLGENDFRPPAFMTFEEYIQYRSEKIKRDNWKNQVEQELEQERKPFAPKINVPGDLFDRIFGGSTIEIRPQGSAEIIFGVQSNKVENPAIPVRNRRQTFFNFDQKIQLNMYAKIGEKVQIPINFNTEAMFDFENQVKLDYTGQEDEIIKKVEAGNVNLPLTGTLITGSQSLFGFKTTLQFGRLTATAIVSQQRGQKKEIEVSNGAQTTKFNVQGSEYEDNRHYFLSQYFYENFDRAMQSLPFIFSQVNITRLEVWVTNINNQQTQNTRNIVAFQDLGESNYYDNSGFSGPSGGQTFPSGPPRNYINDVYSKASQEQQIRSFYPANSYLRTQSNYNIAIDYDVIEQARLLNQSEYTFNPQLGFISLNQRLNPDQVLAVSFQFTVAGSDSVYQVGEFSTDGVAGEAALILKLLKSTNINVKVPLWRLMMKNIYNLGSFNVSPDRFRLDIMYSNVEQGIDINYIPDGNINGKILLQVLGLDKLNVQNDPVADGMFDYLEGRTINPQNGRIILPSVEPFGNYLRQKITNGDPGLNEIADKYTFDALYDTTKIAAQQRPELNRFKIRGSFSSTAGSEIMLNAMNIPQGSVTVTAGGVPLTENVDYTVDYLLGRVKIINSGLMESNKPIKVSLESNQLFGIQQKSLFGTHLNYRVNKDFNIGATVMNLTERPLTQKVNIGNEPMSNTIWGLNSDFRGEAPFLTKLVDLLPFYSTKEKSTVTLNGEFAQLIPGNNKAIGKNGTAYIDDFEGSQSTIDIRNAFQWFLAGTPQGQPDLFPEGELSNDLAFGFNRARLAWYTIDPLFYRNNNLTPAHLNNDQDLSNHYIREVLETELFPNKQPQSGQVLNMPVLDLAFYPSERGPYNYDVENNQYSDGVNPDGTLRNPATRWGGMMRKIETTDFQSANIEYIQFWLMDPYHPDNGIDEPGTPIHKGGDLYFNLGNISEDVLRDDRKGYEHGLPSISYPIFNQSSNTSGRRLDTTAWGVVPAGFAIVNTFDPLPDDRPSQDVGLDGLNDENERTFFNDVYLQRAANLVAQGLLSQAAYDALAADPSTDNFRYFRGSTQDSNEEGILQRYKGFNGYQNNSPANQGGDVVESSTTIPNVEDINRDNTLSINESYFQYKVSLRPGDLEVGRNFIVNKFTGNGQTRDKGNIDVDWYQFKIPLNTPEKSVNGMADFNAIRFLRMFVKGFEQPVVLRFARLEFMRGDWRRYEFDLRQPGEYVIDDNANQTQFDISAVNIEENGTKEPVNYVIPPTINQQVDVGSINLRRLNEQSMVLKVCNLVDGDAKAAYRNLNLDFLMYNKLRMFSHVEAQNDEILNNGDLKLFIRLGRDYNENFYEYEIPLKVTPAGFYDKDAEVDRLKVWPLENDIIIDLEELKDLKRERNGKLNSEGVSINLPYEKRIGAARVTVVGYPNLGNVNTIMIGVRNPKADGTNNDDGLAKCAEVWVNELRLTDFDKQSGWASNLRATAQLADLGNVSVAGQMSTAGFGSIDKRISERQRETIKQYDIATNVELGKLLPKEARISVPFFYSISERFADPQFNPNDPDVEMKKLYKELRAEKRNDEIDSIRKSIQDYTKLRSINFTNVKRTRGGNSTKKPRFYDIENFAFNYGFNEEIKRDVNTEYNNTRQHRAGINYNLNTNPKNYMPFKKIKPLDKKWLKLIQEINFTLFPKQISVSVLGERRFNEMKFRNNSEFPIIIQPTYNKNFTMVRRYEVRWDLTKNLQADFNATNNSRFLEPYGKLDTEQKKDSLIRNFWRGGMNTTYNHQLNLNYNIPLNKIPILDWITAKYRYSATYDWQRAPTAADSLGATIRNSQTHQINGQLNFTNLYNKSAYLKKVGQKLAGTYKPPKKPAVEKNKPLLDPKTGKPMIDPKTGKPIIDTTKVEAKKEKDDSKVTILDHFLGLVMGVKNSTITYTQNGSSLMPGFNDSTFAMGLSRGFTKPGFGFVFGQQDPNFVIKAGQNGWLVKQSILNIPFATTKGTTMNIRVNVEPIKDLKIEITGQRTETFNNSFIYRWDTLGKQYRAESPIATGNFTISYNLFRTAFDDKPTSPTSKTFDQFLANRKIISQRIDNPNSAGVNADGYKDGYGEISQDVLISAFLAAYSGKDASTFDLNTRPKIPLPNWRVNYAGLTKIPFLKKQFKSITISHAYTSTYTIASLTNNVRYKKDARGNSTERDQQGNFLPEFQILSISAIEQFNPLINIDMTWNSSLITKVELKRDRNLIYNFTDNRLQENRGNEIVIGSGYKFKNVKFPFEIGNKKIKNDLTLRADLTIRFNRTMARGVVDGLNQVTAGQKVTTLNISADYPATQRLNLRLFIDQVITKPQISTSFPTSNFSGGLSIRFSLS